MSRGLLLDRAVSLVPEGVQPRLFGQEALGARSGVVLDAGRGPLLLAAAPATGLAAPRVLYGGKKSMGQTSATPDGCLYPTHYDAITTTPGICGSAQDTHRFL